jgi:hypothetical protein
MNTIHSILFIIPPGIQRKSLLNEFQNAVCLGNWLKSEIHFLIRNDAAQLFQLELSHAEKIPSTLIVHTFEKNLAESVSNSVHQHSCDLIVMNDGVVLDSKRGVDQRQILESANIPVLLLPHESQLSKVRFSGFIVPLSGEQRTSSALAVALNLAEQTDTRVDLLHVQPVEEFGAFEHELSELGDQLHHEFEQMVERVVSERSPFSSAAERLRIREFHHCKGPTCPEIAKVLSRAPDSILVLEWSGTLAKGRAQTIKALLHSVRPLILFVRAAQEQKSRLRVGRHHFRR